MNKENTIKINELLNNIYNDGDGCKLTPLMVSWDLLLEVKEIIHNEMKQFQDDETIDDGFGSEWSAWCPMCNEKSMQVVRPGKSQCGNCG